MQVVCEGWGRGVFFSSELVSERGGFHAGFLVGGGKGFIIR